MSDPAHKRRWFRFSLRTLFVMLTVLSVALTLLIGWDNRAKRQHDAMVALSADMSNAVWYEDGLDPEFDLPPVPQFLRGLLDFDHFYDVADVSLDDANDDQMRLLENFPNLEYLCLFSASRCTDAGLEKIKQLKRLKGLDLFDVPGLNDRTLATIGSVKGLQHLKLECGNKVSDAGLEHLSNLHELKSLVLSCGLGVTDRGLASLVKLSKLEELSLDLDDASNVTVEHIDMSWFVEVSSDKPIRGRALASLGKLKRLTSLRISGKAALSDECLSHLDEIPGLQSLALRTTTGLSDSALTHLGKLESLQTLLLDCGPGTETDAGITSLGSLRSLKKLEIGLGQDVSDIGLASLDSCPSLRRLKLRLNNRVTGDGLLRLAKLQYLELDHKTRSDDAPPIQLRLPINLEDLVIDQGAGLTDSDMSALLALHRLQRLDLFYCEDVSDTGLDHLKALSQLRELGIHWCDRVTDTEITGLRASLPNCRITVSKGGGSFGFSSRF